MTSTVFDNTLCRFSIAPTNRTNGTVNGTAVDTNETVGGRQIAAQDASVLVIAGTITDGNHAVTVEDSADGSTGWAAVPAAQRQGSLPTLATAQSNSVAEFGVVDSKRWLRVVVTTSGATTGGTVGAAIILGNPAVGAMH